MSKDELISFEIVRPIDEHGLLVMNWRNDPETLRMSYHSDLKTWNYFKQEFFHDYFVDPLLPPLFGIVEGKRFGFLRFRISEHPLKPNHPCCEVSINIAPAYRNKGLGTSLLKEMILWISERQDLDVYAEILEQNILSRRTFLKAGFEEIGVGEKKIEGEQVFSIRKYLKAHPFQKMKKPVFVIAEAGSNWKRDNEKNDIKAAKLLIEAAAEAQADAVKFQVFKPETVYVANAGQSGYLAKSGIEQGINEIFKHLSMPPEMIPLLAEHCKKCGIEFMASCFSLFDLDLIDPYVKRHKIASYELNHIHLLKKSAQSNKPLILSTGASTLEEIQWSVTAFREFGGRDLTLLQCTAQYPALDESLNLNSISFLRQYFKLPTGLSDHSLDPLLAPIAAVAQGAAVIEKHFTLDRHLEGPDHFFAILPGELKQMVASIRKTEQMLGPFFKSVQKNEMELRQYARRGLQALIPIKVGDIFVENVNYAILRPGNQTLGVHSKYYLEVENKKAKRVLQAGEGIQFGDW